MPRLTARERREGYLREYGYQKRTGKSFFPYALFHDVVANCFFVLLIVGLALPLVLHRARTASTSTTAARAASSARCTRTAPTPAVEAYDPRPEWYFFFLFELLRHLQEPEPAAVRDDHHPDDPSWSS